MNLSNLIKIQFMSGKLIEDQQHINFRIHECEHNFRVIWTAFKSFLIDPNIFVQLESFKSFEGHFFGL